MTHCPSSLHECFLTCLLQSIGLLLVSSVCVSLSLGPKIRLAYKGTTASEEANGGSSASNTSDGKNTADGSKTTNDSKKMQQVRALAMFDGGAATGSDMGTEGALSVREAKMLDALRSLTMDNALLEERNAELLHIARLARSARGKKQASS